MKADEALAVTRTLQSMDRDEDVVIYRYNPFMRDALASMIQAMGEDPEYRHDAEIGRALMVKQFGEY